jgi:hypothetical protein
MGWFDHLIFSLGSAMGVAKATPRGRLGVAMALGGGSATPWGQTQKKKKSNLGLARGWPTTP